LASFPSFLASLRYPALFIGTPRGYDHFYDLYQHAKKQSDWEAFQFTTEEGGNVSLEELEGATHELDKQTYRQEFQASFENLTAGAVYHAFDRDQNVERHSFDPRLPLFWSLDFNVNPMCSVIGQRDGDRVYIIGELALPNSNTWAACEAFLYCIQRWGARPPKISIYGDATGSSRRTAASRTDWQLVREFFKRWPYQISINVPGTNPPVKDRINCMNACSTTKRESAGS